MGEARKPGNPIRSGARRYSSVMCILGTGVIIGFQVTAHMAPQRRIQFGKMLVARSFSRRALSSTATGTRVM
jgi:hypothetical protein